MSSPPLADLTFMDLWSIIDTIFDWICNWRFNLCFYGSLILAAVATSRIQNETLSTIVGTCVLVAAFVIGTRWSSSS